MVEARIQRNALAPMLSVDSRQQARARMRAEAEARVKAEFPTATRKERKLIVEAGLGTLQQSGS